MSKKIRVGIFGCHKYEKASFSRANGNFQFDLVWIESRLTEETQSLVKDFDVVCSFVEDKITSSVLETMKKSGVKLLALRSAGFNHVNLNKAKELNIPVVRVPAYSPQAIAEFTVALLLNISRKIHKSFMRVRDNNFSLEGLTGFNLYKKKIGVLGTGQIGAAFCKIMLGFGCEVMAYDRAENFELKELGVNYVPLDQLLKESDVISLHLPLNPQTQHILNDQAFKKMKEGVSIINTGRGGLIETKSLVHYLKTGKIRAVALDVYEEEEGIFFEDHSQEIIQDDTLMRLMTFPNVVLTSHQAFLTEEALQEIANTTLVNINDILETGHSANLL